MEKFIHSFGICTYTTIDMNKFFFASTQNEKPAGSTPILSDFFQLNYKLNNSKFNFNSKCRYIIHKCNRYLFSFLSMVNLIEISFSMAIHNPSFILILKYPIRTKCINSFVFRTYIRIGTKTKCINEFFFASTQIEKPAGSTPVLSNFFSIKFQI